MNVKKRGLGRGLDALLGEVPNAARLDESVNQTLPVDVLQRGKYQPRRDMNAEKLQELANSIAMQGIVQPIVVRSVSAGRYEIIAGERRWRASKIDDTSTSCRCGRQVKSHHHKFVAST